MKPSQAILLRKALSDDPVYCITKYINRCAWEEGIRISEPMVRATTFFAYSEYLRNHNVPLFDVQTYPFEKGPFGPLVANQYAYTGVWNPGRWLNASMESDRLVIFDEKAVFKYQFLSYSIIKQYFEINYPYLRDIVVRIFKTLDNMEDFKISELLMKISNHVGYKGDVSLQELKSFPLFEDFINNDHDGANGANGANVANVAVPMEMISAHEARKLAKPNFDAHIAFLNERITEAAKQGKTEVIIRKAPYRNWLYDRVQTSEAKAVLDMLKAKGFQCKSYYNEAQFADIGLQIIWE